MLAFSAAPLAGDRDWNAQALNRIVNPPLGLPSLALSDQDAPDLEKIALGRKLFFDPRLSGSARIACASCHVPEQAFTQTDRPTPRGSDGKDLRRNAPSLLNVAFEELLMRDGEAPSLQSQVLVPLFDLHEMANPTFKGLISRLERLPDYQDRFEKAFGAPISVPLIGRAIANYERSLLCARSPFDRWRFGGESGAMAARAHKGFRLFAGKAGCLACHPVGAEAALFTDHGFHNTGLGFRHLPAAGILQDFGRQEVTHEAGDLRKFKTPSLRNVARTAPYMHNGSLKSLADVVRYYNGGGSSDPAQDALIHPLGLSEEEIGDLVAFLESLNCDGIEALIDDSRSETTGH